MQTHVVTVHTPTGGVYRLRFTDLNDSLSAEELREELNRRAEELFVPGTYVSIWATYGKSAIHVENQP